MTKRSVAGLIAAALTTAALRPAVRTRPVATATGTTATTAAEPSEVPEGVAAQYAVLEEEIAEEGGSVETEDWRILAIHQGARRGVVPDGPGSTWSGATRPATRPRTSRSSRSSGRRGDVPDARIHARGPRRQRRARRSEAARLLLRRVLSLLRRTSAYRPTASTQLRATVEAPQFRRHGDESEGPVLIDDAQVEFGERHDRRRCVRRRLALLRLFLCQLQLFLDRVGLIRVSRAAARGSGSPRRGARPV